MAPMAARDLVDRYYARLAEGDVAGLVAMYGDGAEIVRYDGDAGTPDEIGAYFSAFFDRHRAARLRSIDQWREADDVIMWDALVDTEGGILQTVHVVVVDDDGLIRRHIPGVRGYWGQ